MENQKITKRNGAEAAFDPAKITATVERALAGFELDKNKLLETIPNFFKNGMPASEINKALILNALNLTSVLETRNIRYGEGHSIVCDAGKLLPETMVSMNIWGFHPDAVPTDDAHLQVPLPDTAKAPL